MSDESRTTVYLRATSMTGDFGTQVPINVEFDVQRHGVLDLFMILFDEDDDVSELDSWDPDERGYECKFDSGSYVEDFEVVVE